MGGNVLGQVLAVVSGKGGTGKTSLCAGVACALAAEGQSVLCIDADMGLRNLDISLGMTQDPAIPFTTVMRGEYTLSDAAVHPDFSKLRFLTAPVTETAETLDTEMFRRFLSDARAAFDWVLIDAPAGVGAGFQVSVRFADLAMVVTGGEPAALRDGARTAQALEQHSTAQAGIVVNRIRRKFFRQTRSTVDDCMDIIGLPLLGIVPEDPMVPLAAAVGKPLLGQTKKAAAMACIHIARRLCGVKQPLLKL